MLNGSESLATFVLFAAVAAILIWGYNRAKAFGKLGILAWLQSIVLMSPWLLFFGLFAVVGGADHLRTRSNSAIPKQGITEFSIFLLK